MVKTHKIRLYPTKAQEILLRKSCGVARYSYNWALAKWKEMFEAGEKPSAYTLIKLQNKIKREQMPFFLEVTKCAPQYAIHNLEMAFKKFFRKESNYPKFKRRGVKDSFVAIENAARFINYGDKIHIPRIGKINAAESLRFDGKLNHVIVSRIANRWFATINIEVRDSPPTLKRNESGDNQAIVGVDFGIKSMMVLSDGTVYENPKALKKNLKRLKRLQRRLSKKQLGSRNRDKAKVKLATQHYKVSCIRSNAIHKATSEIISKYDKIVIEDLNVRGMLMHGGFTRLLPDVSFGEVRRQLAYKAQWSGKELVIADRFFASSKTCSNCSHKKQSLKLSERIYKCENCGLEIDRDLNAAKNLANYSPTLKCKESNACGGSETMPKGKCLPANQEVSNLTSN